MGRLFKNELMKLKYSRTLWLFWGVVLGLVLLFSVVPGIYFELESYGYTTAFVYMRNCGTFVLMFLAPIAGSMFTLEFYQGTMQNTLSCWVSRPQYFAVKVLCLFVTGILVYLSALVVFVGIRSLRLGFRPEGMVYPDYGLSSLAFHGGTCLLLCTYMALYILISLLVKRPGVVYLSGAIATVVETSLMNTVPGYSGVIPTVVRMYEMAEERRVLTGEFAGLFVQSSVMCAAFLLLSYLIFLRKDIN